MPTIASKIMLIRHAEKPGIPGGGSGVAIDGTDSPDSLTVRGWTRAGALVWLFADGQGQSLRAGLAEPRLVYASGVGKRTTSLRSQQTVLPLCEKLGLAANTDFLKPEGEAMTDDALSGKGPVLICWPHQHLPVIANRILGDATTAPQAWPEDRFDMVWVFDRDMLSGEYHFQQVPQCLLAGDLLSPLW